MFIFGGVSVPGAVEAGSFRTFWDIEDLSAISSNGTAADFSLGKGEGQSMQDLSTVS